MEMVRPVVLHSGEVGRAMELGAALGKALGRKVEVAPDVAAILRSRSGSGVFVLPSAALLDWVGRVELLNCATVVWVKDSGGDSGVVNDGLGSAERARVQGLLAGEYGECHLTVEPERVGMVDALDQVIAVVARGPVSVAAGERSYLVEVGRGNLESALGARAFQGSGGAVSHGRERGSFAR
ncbi:MAG: hypothetical protein QM784_34410 [Polyangiaceae bacterium]